MCVFIRVRENIAPISGCRVSEYAQRVITLSWQTSSSPSSLLVCMPSSSRPLFCWTVLIPSLSYFQRCTLATCTFTPWRVSRGEEIRFAPRENGVIIYEGGKERKGINHNGEEAMGHARLRARSLASAEKAAQKKFQKLFSSLEPGRDENFKRAKSA